MVFYYKTEKISMNKRAILGLMVAIILPFAGYFIVKYYGEAAVQMPHKYFFDSVAVTQNNGKIVTDTIKKIFMWHLNSRFAIIFYNKISRKW